VQSSQFFALRIGSSTPCAALHLDTAYPVRVLLRELLPAKRLLGRFGMDDKRSSLFFLAFSEILILVYLDYTFYT
jgi:hypothetical protein